MFDSKTLNSTQISDLVNGYNDGKETLISLSKKLGCSIPTVGRLLKKHGATMRGKGRPKGSKTVNRRPKIDSATSTSTSVTAGVNDEKLAAESAVPSSDLDAFRQKVMQFTKTA